MNTFVVSMNTFGESMNTFGVSMNTFGESMNTFGESMNTFGESMNTFGESMNTFGVSLNTSYRRAMEARCYLRHNRRCAVRTIGYFSRRSAIFCNEGAPVVGLSTAQVAHCIFTSFWLLGFVCFLLNILYLKAKSTADLCIQIKIFGSGSGLNI